MDDLTGLESASVEDRYRAVLSALGIAVGSFVVAILVVFAGIQVLALTVALPSDGTTPAWYYPVTTVLQGLGFGIAVAIYLARTENYDLIRVRIPSLRDLGAIVVGVLGLLAALLVVSVVFSSFGVETAQNAISQVGTENPEIMLYMIPLAFLVIGPGEELVFRAVVQGRLRGAYAAIPAVAIASAIFAVAHFQALLGGSLSAKAATIAALFALSLILGGVYEYTDNLVVPAMVHGAYDAFVFISIYVTAVNAV